MTKEKISYADLVHRVVQNAPQPITVAEIMEQVQAIKPITTKNPKSTISNAVSQSHLIVAVGNRRYGWKPRVLTGSVLRLTLTTADSTGDTIEITDEVRDALWPTFFEIQKRSDRNPVQMELPTGETTPFPLQHLERSRWGSPASPAFRRWFNSLNATEGDHLIIEVVDGEARHYRVRFERFADRDEPTIAARNQAIVGEVTTLIRRKPRGVAIWDISSHLLSTGQYRQPVPPDPLEEILAEAQWGPNIVEAAYGGAYFWDDSPPPPVTPDPQLSELFGASVQVYDYENPPDLPREYDPDKTTRRPRSSRKAKKGTVKTFTFRVNHRALPQVWREVELAEDQTLEDLHLIIQQAFDWGDDHLYSFFMSGQPWHQESEIGCPWSDASLHTHQVQLGQLDLQAGQVFLYLFDYGDGHEFDVALQHVNPGGAAGGYPKIVARQGEAPAQYPNYDDETGEPGLDWDPHAHYGR